MIHTFDFFIKLTMYNIEYFQRKHGIYFDSIVMPKELGISLIKIYPNEVYGWLASFHVEAIMLLQKSDIAESDLPFLKNEINSFIRTHFGEGATFATHVLQRIDYRFDAVIPNSVERQLIIDLFNKVESKKGRQTKKTHYTDEDGIRQAFDTSCYHSSKSISAIIYDKEEERISGNKIIESHEKDVLRIEVSVRKTHIYGRERSHDIPRRLDNYLTKTFYRYYMQKYVLNIFPTSDFYKLSEAEKVISSSSLKTSEKMALKSMLDNITNGSVDTVKRRKSPATFKKYMNLFKSLDIHPIVIQKHKKVRSHVPNPLKSLLL